MYKCVFSHTTIWEKEKDCNKLEGARRRPWRDDYGDNTSNKSKKLLKLKN